ncbi:uroporphyrinogen decarboxylase [Sulfobacillus acidophilus TPY]|uniref:Uroporphyrinogen decarboxylase n=1 Tax=Sulfobacillus acidophilus (strain ATCC 700253 / DSM 10332 / NAL) TaxID=679936 RepID=G8TY28_SULAD|nr:uroporphyrinogen decarboxylase [Sulfobacillus acidophilus TPY]AEW03935.1 uroporphyrinogen decarboxylase [Sulfobacillus acidophilus DSM 10332]
MTSNPLTSRFIRACWRQPVDRIPVWFMRQAGRYQPSYRALRRQYSLLEIAHRPELIQQVTVTAVEDLQVDAAILFSDIMVPLEPMGIGFDIQEAVGPVVHEPIRTIGQVERLKPVNPSRDLDFVLEGIERTVAALGQVPLIGFSGGPFTLASYVIEGGPSRTYQWTKSIMWNAPNVWSGLMERLAAMVVTYLTAQVAAGASAVQVFDSWIGALSRPDYERFVEPYMTTIFAQLKALQVPLIYFGVGTAHLLPAMARTGATVLGVDWRTPLRHVRRLLGDEWALQGNLDPVRLLAGWPAVKDGAEDILRDMGNQPGFIFNLGHGVPKETDPVTLRQLVDWIHHWPVEPAPMK